MKKLSFVFVLLMLFGVLPVYATEESIFTVFVLPVLTLVVVFSLLIILIIRCIVWIINKIKSK